MMATPVLISRFIALIFAGLLSLAVTPAAAVPFAIPAPLVAEAGPDIDGSGYFNPADNASVAIELFDLAGSTAPLGTRLGFYRQGAPGALFTIFEITDQQTIADPQQQRALIDFATGRVLDWDSGQASGTLQNVFAPGTNPFGLFVQILGLGTFFSDPLLNPGGVDVFGAFPRLASSRTIFPTFFSIQSDGTSVPLHISLLTNVVPIPGPQTLALLVLGLALAGASRIRAYPRAA